MGMIKEFKEFAIKGNIVELAVAVVLGAAFVKVVTALTSSLIMPILGVIIGKDAFAGMSFVIGGVIFPIGVLIQALIEFILVAFVLFLIIKALNSLRKKEPEVVAATPEDILLLRQIRDSLKK